MAGITPQGLVVRTDDEVLQRIKDKLRETFPGIDLSEGPEHVLAGVVAEEMGLVWEAIAAAVMAQGPSASGLALDEVAALTGTIRRPASRSTVTATVTLAAGATLPVGVVAAVLNNPDAQFRTTAPVENATSVAAEFPVPMESVQLGPVAAPAGQLTVIVTSSAGWTEITNAASAVLGRAVATDVELRAQRLVELAGLGTQSEAAIRAAVARVTTALSVSVRTNESFIVDGDGRPPKSLEVIVWDGGDVTMPVGHADAVAQAILDTKPAAIPAWGVGSTVGNAVDRRSDEIVEVEFTRATKLRCYAAVQVVLAGDAGPEWETAVKNGLRARAALYAVGEKVYASQLVAGILDDVAGIVAVTSLTIGTAPSPVGSSVTPLYYEMADFALADIGVTEAP